MKFLPVLVASCVWAFAESVPILEQRYSPDGIYNDDEIPYETVCFGDLGCFDNKVSGVLPAHPDAIAPSYLMFSRQYPQRTRMSWDDSTEELRRKTEGFVDEEKPLIFLCHGWTESSNTPWMSRMKDAVLKVYPNANVVMIDWRAGASRQGFYPKAAANVPVIANMTVRLTVNLMRIAPAINSKNIYFIGFSLGAQMAGYYSREFTKQTGMRIGRITSLDAAGPLFEDLGIVPRRGDADFVEAIHTSVGTRVILGEVGFIAPYGDIDFYPNGGRRQPRCTFACSHRRAYEYLISAFENVDMCRFKGTRCTTLDDALNSKCTRRAVAAYIGQKDIADFRRFDRGFHIVYLETDSEYPYCRKG